MKKKNFFRNCNAGRMLLVIVCLAALFASPQRAWADDDKVSVTIDGNTTKYGIVDEAMIAVNAATSNVTVKLLTDVELLVNPDPEHLQYGNIRFANTNTVTEESGTRPVMIILDLNGHTLSSGNDEYVIGVDNGTSVTITGGTVENTADFAIQNEGKLYTNNIVINASKGIYNFNNAEAFIRGGNITTNSYCIENWGTIEVSGTKLTSSNNDAIINYGVATIGEGVSFENCNQNGIYNENRGTLKMTALPTFTNSGEADIRLEKGGVIDFGTGLTAPTNPVSVKVEEKDDWHYVAADLPYAFTKGYKTAFSDGTTGTTVDPTEVFTIDGANVVLAGGEAVAYDTTKPLVAVNTASDGSITGLYAVDGTTYTTDAEALTAAVTAANAATGDVTVSLLGDVDLGATYVTFNNTNTVGSGDDERTVKITLDLNGKTITGSSYIYGYVVEIAAGADVTIIGGDNSTPASIINTGSNTSVISNEGTLAVTGIGISETYIGINNYQSGVVVVTNCNISGGNNGIANSGELTIGAGVTIKDFTICGISNSGNLTLNAVPTFTDATNAQWDIVLADFEVSPYQPITLGTGLTKPTSPIRVKVMDYDDNNNAYVLAALPYVFTKGYKAAFTDGTTGETVDPADVFTISGANIVLIGGEAVAYDTNKPLVAYNTASDGSLIGLYAQDDNDITTDAAALTKAFNALADGTTLTLCKNVDAGNLTPIVTKGTAEAPVTIDLNGYKISDDTEYSVLQIGSDNAPTVIVKNGTIENSHTETGRAITSYGNITLSDVSIAGILAIYNGGALTVSGGTIEGKDGFAIYNDPTATSCTIGAATIKSDNNVGIRADSNVTFTAWPTFSGNSTDIDLTESAKIVLGDGFAVPATEFNKIKVSADGNAPLTITSGYAAHCTDGQSNVIDPTSVFAWSGGGNYILVLDDNEVVKKMPTVTVTLPAGLSTYYNNIGMRVVDSHADGVKMYAVSAVSDNQVVLKEITRRAIPAYTPVIISNSGTAALACTFEEAATSAREGDFVQMFYNDLGEADLAEAFKGTATNITAYEPANGATLYGLNGEAFVKIDGTPNIDAHRCWLEIPATASARTRTLTIVFDGSDTTGIRDVREVNAVRGAKDDTWYSLDGRKLDGKPKAKGLYIVNGKKVIIKK
ncbi:MAG: hypothetical protein IKM76_02190 [Prevotella sp.]|nr:hypothetical protein [Prevotella sp.]MBR6826958.1 hypothetical protein [Prevotella sp.]